MNKYIENPKTKGSGILAAIPQEGTCPNNCEDCFFQSGRSYLEPLDENLPNLPSMEEAAGRIIRVNDGNDSNIERDLVIEKSIGYTRHFYNTAKIESLETFPGPVVLTINPGKMTDKEFYVLPNPPNNLMFVRVRVNTWNILDIVAPAIHYYSEREVPIVLTFMAYFNTSDKIPADHRKFYMFRKRTLNSYWAITTAAWEKIMHAHRYNRWVYSCGKIEGEKGDTHCRFCGNCLREYFTTMERMRND